MWTLCVSVLVLKCRSPSSAKIEFFSGFWRWCACCFCFRTMKKPAKTSIKVAKWDLQRFLEACIRKAIDFAVQTSNTCSICSVSVTQKIFLSVKVWFCNLRLNFTNFKTIFFWKFMRKNADFCGQKWKCLHQEQLCVFPLFFPAE